MDLELSGQVAVVVGGARGLGLAIATAFAQERARVVLLDVSPDVRAAAEKLGGQGYVVDVTDFAAVKAAAEKIGRVDHVAFAAGIGSGKFGFPFWKLDPSEWARVLNVPSSRRHQSKRVQPKEGLQAQ